MSPVRMILRGKVLSDEQSSKPSGRIISYLRDNWARIYFYAAILLLVFGYGLAAGSLQLFPYELVRQGVSAARDWTSNAEHYARIRPDKHLRYARHEGKGVTVLDEQRVWPGNTLLAGMWGEQLGFRLVNKQGDILHEWWVSYNEIWPESPHLRFQPHDWDTNIHGFVVYPNGDIVFNFEHNGLVAIDSCSNVRWKLAAETHHDVYRTAAGNLWVPDSIRVKEKDPRFPLVKPPFYEEFLLEISPDGEVLRKISLLEILVNSGYDGLLVDPTDNIGTDDWKGTVTSKMADITHLNDIDVLEPPLAESFPQFAAGDLLLSLRNLDLLLVVDPDAQKVKWVMTGPWLMQHDPDFLDNGKMLVYDNRSRLRSMAPTEGSRILEVDPVSREVKVVYGGSEEDPFYSSQMGKQQGLPNGNILFSEPDGGRIVEIDSRGEIVWQYVNRWSEAKVAVMTEGLRLDEDYFENSLSSCQNKADEEITQ